MFPLEISSLGFLLICIASITPISSITQADFFPYVQPVAQSIYTGTNYMIKSSFSSPFKIFNKTHSSISIRNNGVVGFGSVSLKNPDCGGSTNVNSENIGVFWTDIFPNSEYTYLKYMETSSVPLLKKAQKDITAAFPLLNKRQLNLSWMFIITWQDNARYGSNTTYKFDRNAFQLVLTKSESHSFVLLYYLTIEWPKSRQWAAGFNIGNSHPIYQLPGSCTSNFSSLTQESNFGNDNKGKWVFGVESNLRLPERHISIQKRVVSVMGNVPIVIRGLDLVKQANFTITCIFHDPSRSQPSETNGIDLYNGTTEEINIVCPVPFMYSLGRMQINLLVKQNLLPTPTATMYKSHIYVVKEHDLGPLPQIFVNMTQKSPLLSASWNQSSVLMDEIKALETSNNQTTTGSSQDYIEIVLLEFKRNSWKELGSVTPPIPINGSYLSPLNMTILYELTTSSWRKPYLRNFALKYKYKLASGATMEKLIPSDTLIASDTIISAMETHNSTSSGDVAGNVYDPFCKTWYEKEPQPPTHLDTLPCPRTVEQAQHDWRFLPESASISQLEILHPGASSSFLQKVPSASGAASRCTYNNQGSLLISNPGAGYFLRHSPNNGKNYWEHYRQDILPYLCCCRWSPLKESNCIPYFYSKRPLNVGKNYVVPRPARSSGLAHISTFDASDYTLLGAGEFWFIKYSSGDNDGLPAHDYHTNEFKLQVRMEMFNDQHSNENLKHTSVITAAVMESIGNDKQVKIEVYLTPSRAVVMMNDQPLNRLGQDELLNFDLYADGLAISFQSENKMVFTFYSGYSIMIMSSGGNDSALNIIATATPHIIEKTNGLLKKFEYAWFVKRNESMFTDQSGNAYKVDNNNNSKFIPATTESFYMTESLPPREEGDHFCNGFQECNYDYHLTNSSFLAKAGMQVHTMYENLLRVANLVVNQCDLTESLENGYFNVTSLVVGSNMTMSCNSGYVIHPQKMGENFTCQNLNSSSLQGAIWVNAVTNESISIFTCVPENTDVSEFVEHDFTSTASTTTNKIVGIETTDATKTTDATGTTLLMVSLYEKANNVDDEDSYEIWLNDKWFALLIYIIVVAIIVAVIVVVTAVCISKCSCCTKLRMYCIYSYCVIRRDDVELAEI